MQKWILRNQKNNEKLLKIPAQKKMLRYAISCLTVSQLDLHSAKSGLLVTLFMVYGISYSTCSRQRELEVERVKQVQPTQRDQDFISTQREVRDRGCSRQRESTVYLNHSLMRRLWGKHLQIYRTSYTYETEICPTSHVHENAQNKTNVHFSLILIVVGRRLRGKEILFSWSSQRKLIISWRQHNKRRILFLREPIWIWPYWQ